MTHEVTRKLKASGLLTTKFVIFYSSSKTMMKKLSL